MKPRRVSLIWIATVSALVMLLAAAPGSAQNKKLRDQVSDVELAIERLEKKISDLVGTDDPKKIREGQTAVAADIQALGVRVDELKKTSEESAAEGEEQATRLDAMADEVETLWSEVENHKAEIDELKNNEQVGYDKGFFIKSKDGKHKLTIGGFVKPYYQFVVQKAFEYDSQGFLASEMVNGQRQAIGGDTEVVEQGFGLASTRLDFKLTTFDIVNFRLQIDYGTLSGKVSYPANAQVDGDDKLGKVKTNSHSLRTLAAYGELAPMDEFKLRIGQFKVPFDLEYLSASARLMFAGRSLMTKSYNRYGEGLPTDDVAYGHAYETQRGSTFGYDTGFMLHGSIGSGMFNYAAGMFNGSGMNKDNDNRDMAVVVRVSSDFLGKMSGGSCDLEVTEKPLISVGAAFAYDLPLHTAPNNLKETYNSSDINVTGDVHFKWYGVALMTGVFYRNADHGAVFREVTTNATGGLEWGENRPIQSFGYMGQIGYYIKAIKLQPAFRYSIFDADTERELDHVHEFTAGVNYYPLGNDNLKFIANWRGMFAADKLRSYLKPWTAWTEDSNEVTIMAQFAF